MIVVPPKHLLYALKSDKSKTIISTKRTYAAKHFGVRKKDLVCLVNFNPFKTQFYG